MRISGGGHREGEALDVGAEGADVLRQRLGQHVDAPLDKVCRRPPVSNDSFVPFSVLSTGPVI